MECIDTRGVRVCMSTSCIMWAIFLERPSVNFPLLCLSLHSLLPALHRCFHIHSIYYGWPATISQRTHASSADERQLSQYATSFARLGPDFDTLVPPYCATPTTDLPGLQERQLSTRPHTIVVHPKSRYLSMRSSKWAAATRAGGSSVTS